MLDITEREPTNEEIEADADVQMRQLANLSEEVLRHGYRELLVLNAYLRRSLMESVSRAKVIYVGPKGCFDGKSQPALPSISG